MNNVRKEIIEIIGEYMDKTLSFGCVIKHIESNDYGLYTKDFNILFEEDGNVKYENEEEIYYFCDILGHYDITAVMKYIKSKIDCETKVYIQSEDIIWDKVIYEDNVPKHKLKARIPNKPLNLYNEEEEKYLLNLLNKIAK